MTIFGVVCVLVGIVAVWCLYDRNEDKAKQTMFWVALVGSIALILGAFILWFITLGKLAGDTTGAGRFLAVNQIYETVSSTMVNGGKYAVILRQQDGSLRAYLLDSDPPKRFKRSSDKKAPYRNYP